MKNSIIAKLSLIVVLIFAVIMIANAIYSYKKTSEEVTSLYSSIQNLALSASYTTINITMNIEAIQHLKVASDAILKTNDINEQRKVLRIAADLVKYPSFIVVYEDSGNILLEEYGVENPDPHNYDQLGIDIRQRPWYQETKEKKQSIVTPVYTSAAGTNKGKQLATVTYPLIKDGVFIGVIAADVYVSDFQERFKNFERPEFPSLDIYITDNTGRIFSHKNPEIVAHQELYPQEIALQEHLKSAKEGFFSYIDTEGKDRVGFYRQFPFGWTIVASALHSDYTDAVNKNALTSLAINLIMLILGIVILVYIIKKFISPVQEIQKLLLHFFQYLNHENKQAPKPLVFKSKDEFGQMATTINENIKRTGNNIEKDAKLVEEALVVINHAKDGQATKRITLEG
ncbi:methyl-accepting chemotaxis protein, partial [Campylobacter sp. MIT 19-121]|uniref:cache domain-containing protein n=1 Tax=Campylobacter sp. MIT 19-121 TaxID=2703906 RepID=UPI00139CC9AC